MSSTKSVTGPSTKIVAVALTLFLLMASATGFVSVFYRNPASAAPGLPVAEVWAQVAESRGGTALIGAAILLAIVPLAALALCFSVISGTPISATTAAGAYLGLSIANAPLYVFGSLGPAWRIADTFSSGGDHGPLDTNFWALAAITCALSAAALTLSAISQRRRDS